MSVGPPSEGLKRSLGWTLPTQPSPSPPGPFLYPTPLPSALPADGQSVADVAAHFDVGDENAPCAGRQFEIDVNEEYVPEPAHPAPSNTLGEG